MIGYDYCELETALLGLTGERDAATANPWETKSPLPLASLQRSRGPDNAISLREMSTNTDETTHDESGKTVAVSLPTFKDTVRHDIAIRLKETSTHTGWEQLDCSKSREASSTLA